MSRAPDHATFVACLRREVSSFDDFITLLRAEQECLTQPEIEPLTDLSRRKTEMVEELSTLARLRCAFLEAQAVEASAQGMRGWMKKLGPAQGGELASLWERLNQNADEAQRLNRINGMLINNRLAFNREALNALSGLTRPQGVYGRDGSTALRVAHRDFGAA
jgi:flagellar biosynthesis protein FlgN